MNLPPALVLFNTAFFAGNRKIQSEHGDQGFVDAQPSKLQPREGTGEGGREGHRQRLPLPLRFTCARSIRDCYLILRVGRTSYENDPVCVFCVKKKGVLFFLFSVETGGRGHVYERAREEIYAHR